MIDPLTVALVTSVVSGFAGTNATALVALHATNASVAWVNGAPVALDAGETTTVPVTIPLREGLGSETITVTSGGVSYKLRVATVGQRTARLHWWAPLAAVPLALFSVRVRRGAGSS